MRTEQMNVSLTGELARFVRSKVRTGLYNNASEFMRELIRDRKDREERRKRVEKSIEDGLSSGSLAHVDLADSEDDATIAAVRAGLQSVEQGRYVAIDSGKELSDFFQGLRTKAKRKAGSTVESAERRRSSGPTCRLPGSAVGPAGNLELHCTRLRSECRSDVCSPGTHIPGNRASPGIGTACDHVARGVRKLPVGNYVIYYMPERERIVIARVIHGRDVRRRHFEKGVDGSPLSDYR